MPSNPCNLGRLHPLLLIADAKTPKLFGWGPRQCCQTHTTWYALAQNVRYVYIHLVSGRVAQSLTCLATDASLTADPGVASLIQARSHTFVEIDHEIVSTVILLPSAESFKKGCCLLQAKVFA